MRLSRQVAERMKTAGHGTVLNMGWNQASTGMAGDSGQLFAAAKGAVMAFTKSLARELASRQITVNAVAPGLVPETGMTADLQESAAAQMLVQVPLGRAGTPEEVAHAVAFLASDQAAYITGHVLTVDGGMTM